VLTTFRSTKGSREIVVITTTTKSKTLKALPQNFQNQLHAMFRRSSQRKISVKTTSSVLNNFGLVPRNCSSTMEAIKFARISKAIVVCTAECP